MNINFPSLETNNLNERWAGPVEQLQVPVSSCKGAYKWHEQQNCETSNQNVTGLPNIVTANMYNWKYCSVQMFKTMKVAEATKKKQHELVACLVKTEKKVYQLFRVLKRNVLSVLHLKAKGSLAKFCK